MRAGVHLHAAQQIVGAQQRSLRAETSTAIDYPAGRRRALALRADVARRWGRRDEQTKTRPPGDKNLPARLGSCQSLTSRGALGRMETFGGHGQ
jgi:hypothetical protein